MLKEVTSMEFVGELESLTVSESWQFMPVYYKYWHTQKKTLDDTEYN